jgi:hypothetical protein
MPAFKGFGWLKNWIAFSALILLMGGRAAAQAQTMPAYIVAVQIDDQVVVRGYSPTNIDGAALWQIPVPPSARLLQAALSPNRRYIAVVVWAGSNNTLLVLDTITDEVSQFSGFLVAPRDPGSIEARQPNIIWSPDSRWAAFNVVTDGSSDVYVYNSLTDSLINVTADTAEQFQFAWANQTASLAIATSFGDSSAIEIYNVQSGQVERIIALSPIIIGPIGPSSLCQMQWSPEDTAVAFAETCDSSSLQGFKEVYVVALSTQQITKVTNLTEVVDVQSIEFYSRLYARYNIIWYSADYLLIGAIYSTPEAEGLVTLGYTVSTNTTEVLLQNAVTEEWAHNRVNNVLASRQVTSSLGVEPVVSSVQIQTLQNESLNSLRTLPTGCDLAWSPDGTILAYTDRGPLSNSNRCTYGIVGLHFFDTAAQQSTYSPLLLDTYTSPTGWYAGSAPTVTPTPSATPTPTPAP